MNKLALRNYFETNSKYSKLKKRFDKKVKSGVFYKLSTNKQRSLVARLRKLFEKLLQLKQMLKLAAAGATIGMILTAGQANAQDFKMQKPFKGKFLTEQQSPKGFESDLFIQMSGSNNPLGGENPFGGIFIEQANYSHLVDIDNDGDLDVFTPKSNYPASSDYNILFQKNIGNSEIADLEEQTGTSNPLESVLTTSRPYMSFVDIDNDNDYDLFINDQYSNEILYYKNIGTPEAPEFEQQLDASNPLNGEDPFNSDRLYFADIDDDGDLDFFMGKNTGYHSYSNILYLYRNTGTAESPAFTPEDATTMINYNPGWFESVLLTDMDGDNDYDLLFNGEYYLKNVGNSTTPQFEITNGSENPFNDIMWLNSGLPFVIDNDDDGDLDLFVGAYTGIKYYKNVGTPSYPYLKDQNGIQVFNYVNDPEFADIDGDGDFDLIVSGYDLSTSELSLQFVENVGTPENPEFELSHSTNNPLSNIDVSGYLNSCEFVDIDNDGDLDLFIGKYNSPYQFIDFYKNVGTSADPIYIPTSIEENPLSGVSGSYAFISFADIDNDGDSDLFIGDGNTVRFFNNTGTASVPEFVEETSPITLPANINIAIPDFADVDNDGDLDFFAGSANSDTYGWSIIHFLNQGTPETPDFIEQTGASNPLEILIRIPIPAFVDIDNDSDQDCFVGTLGSTFLYFKNKSINVSVENIKANSLNLYPNPTNGTVSFDTEIFENQEIVISITDITGKQMSNFEMIDYNKLDLSNLKAGIYFIKISDGKKSEMSKIVVQ